MTVLQYEPALLLAALDASSEAVVLCGGADDTVLLVNAAAAALVPGLAPGGRFVPPGHLLARRRQLGDDHYGWFLRDGTAEVLRARADTAAILQADLLPPELPQPDGIELAGSYQAAREALRIGGDFYDVFGPRRTAPTP